MVAFLKRPEAANGLDARIAGLSSRRTLGIAPAPPLPPPAAVPEVEPASFTSQEDRLLAARDQLSIRLKNEIRLERRHLLSRGELAKLVDAAVQTYLLRHAIDSNALERRDLVTGADRGSAEPDRGCRGGRSRRRTAPRQPQRDRGGKSANPAARARAHGCRRRRRHAARHFRGAAHRLGQGIAGRDQDPAQFQRAARSRPVVARRHARAGPARAADRRRDRNRHHGQRTQAGLCRAPRQARADRYRRFATISTS